MSPDQPRSARKEPLKRLRDTFAEATGPPPYRMRFQVQWDNITYSEVATANASPGITVHTAVVLGAEELLPVRLVSERVTRCHHGRRLPARVAVSKADPAECRGALAAETLEHRLPESDTATRARDRSADRPPPGDPYDDASFHQCVAPCGAATSSVPNRILGASPRPRQRG